MSEYSRVQQSITGFQAGLELKHQCWVEIRRLNPELAVVSEEAWLQELDRHWVLCEDGTTKLSKGSQSNLQGGSPTEVKLASSLYGRWQEEVGEKPEFPAPRATERLDDYCCRLAAEIGENKVPTQPKERCLRSFLSYVRTVLPSPESVFLEHIFPEEMEIREHSDWTRMPTPGGEELKQVPRSMILRRVHPRGYPIPISWAACILRVLADRVFQGRPDSQRTSAVVLGLCWVCLTVARLRLPVRVRDLLQLSSSCLTAGSPTTLPTMKIPTMFGERAIPIPKTLWSFLDALQHNGVLFNRTEKSLYRELARAVIALPEGLLQGRIGFQTFLIFPHEFGNHRYQPPGASHRGSRERKKCQSLCKS